MILTIIDDSICLCKVLIMRIFAGVLVALLIVSCSSEPFQANKDNEYLVGKWTVVEVDDADALVHQDAFLNSIINEQFKENDVLEFNSGPSFELYASDNSSKMKGQYAITEGNKSVKIQLPDNHIIEYSITEKSDNQLKLDVKTAGEVVNLLIEKQ